MPPSPDNLHSEFHRMQDRRTKEMLLQQRAHVFWFYGLIIAICSFITPKRKLRHMAREVIGGGDCIPIFTRASFEACAERDVHGLYAKAKSGEIKNFTAHSSRFEEPGEGDPDWIIPTEDLSEEETLVDLLQRIHSVIEFESAITI